MAHINYKTMTKKRLQKHAATFTARSASGELSVEKRAFISKEEFTSWGYVNEDLYGEGATDYSKKGGLLGMTDQIMSAYKGRFVGFPLHLWTRRQIYNRLRWLKGELTRLMINEPPFKGTPEERQAAITKRKGQINKYADALVELKPLHDEIERQRRVRKQFKRRHKQRVTKRKDEIKAALEASRTALQPHH